MSATQIPDDNETEVTRRRHRTGGIRPRAMTAILATGLMAGGVAGGFVVANAASSSTSTSGAATTTATPATPAPAGSSTTPFVSNENATHEAGESAAREAQENAGQMPTVP